MSSLFKSKRSSADVKSSSKSSNVTEPDSKTQKGTTSSGHSSKSSGSTVHSPSSPPPMPQSAQTGGGAAPNSRQTSSSSSSAASKLRERKTSVDLQEWLATECPIDSRMIPDAMPNNTLSISRSGRYKAKVKVRTKLFSEDADAGSQDDHTAVQASRGSSTLATPEDRQTVLEAMAKRPGAAPSGRSSTAKQSPSGGNSDSGANKKSSEHGTKSRWSTTSNSTDL